MKTFGERFLEFRKFYNLSQEQLAIIIGARQQYIGHYEHNTRKLNGFILYNLQKAFPKLNIDWLMYGNGEMLLNEEINPSPLGDLAPQEVKELQEKVKILETEKATWREERAIWKEKEKWFMSMLDKVVPGSKSKGVKIPQSTPVYAQAA